YGGFAVNALDSAPFRLAEGEWKLRAEPTSPRLDRGRVTINVTSDGASVAQVTAVVRSPNGASDLITLIHPQVAVPNNVLEEFWTYLTNMLVGNFGVSLFSKQPVWNEIAVRVGPSMLLFGSAVIISYALGILIGAVLAWRRGSKMELGSIVVSLFFYSMPVFWFGLILLWGFAYILHWFPLGGFGGVDLQGNRLTGLAYAGDVLHHMALPLVNLVILSLAGHVLLMRNSMLEVLGEDYITTARAKGLRERRIMYRHAARNALLPVVTAFALAISGVISGGVLTETIFSWPGMGAFLISATLAQDFPSVQGAFYLLALLTIFANLVADILYAYLDPRVRL
ncbi:MAG TPA: ABC transporter permease, partial [Thermoplasmata archaeon]|nr:ABC transporter permease [Thermoplasmata archaeon]